MKKIAIPTPAVCCQVALQKPIFSNTPELELSWRTTTKHGEIVRYELLVSAQGFSAAHTGFELIRNVENTAQWSVLAMRSEEALAQQKSRLVFDGTLAQAKKQAIALAFQN